MVSSANSHTNATRIGWHLWEIDFRFAPGLSPGWSRTPAPALSGCVAPGFHPFAIPRAAAHPARPRRNAGTRNGDAGNRWGLAAVSYERVTPGEAVEDLSREANAQSNRENSAFRLRMVRGWAAVRVGWRGEVEPQQVVRSTRVETLGMRWSVVSPSQQERTPSATSRAGHFCHQSGHIVATFAAKVNLPLESPAKC